MIGIATLVAAVNLTLGVNVSCMPHIGPPEVPTYDGARVVGTVTIYLQNRICNRLVRLRQGMLPTSTTGRDMAGYALFVFGHEIGHAKLDHKIDAEVAWQERQADKYAERNWYRVGCAIGVREKMLRELAWYYAKGRQGRC